MLSNADLILVTRGQPTPASTGVKPRRVALGKLPFVPLNISNQKTHANIGHIVVPFTDADDSEMLLPGDSITIKPDAGAERTYRIDTVVIYGGGLSLGHWAVAVTDPSMSTAAGFSQW